MAFLYLLLGHLLGDFVFQTNKIAQNKLEHIKWSVLHAVIVTICILPFSLYFGYSVICLVFLNGILHFLIDYYKPVLEKRNPLPGVVYFFADQALHILLLYFISTFAYVVNTPSALPQYVDVLIAVIISTSYAAVQNQFILSLFFPNVRKKFFETGEKSVGNITRLVNTFAFYFAYLVSPRFLCLLIVSISVLIIQYRTRWGTWSEKGYFAVKIVVDLLVSFASFIILLL